MKKPSANSDVTFKAGDVVVVPFPYVDQLAEKRRPALVISNRAFNMRNGLVWVAMITSADNPAWPDDIPLPIGKTGLETNSTIRTAKIATLDANRIVRIAGRIDKATHTKVTAALSAILN
jgi:mRNA interferase MazF